MKKTKFMKVLALMLIALLSLSALSGCGGGGGGATAGDGDLAGGEPVNLVYWSMWNEAEPQGAAIKEAIDAFMAEHSNVAVTINWQGREIRKTLQPALDGGEVIDMWDEDLERVIKTWSSYATPVDEFMDMEYPSTGGKAYKDSVLQSLLILGSDIAKGQGLDGTWAVPYQPYVFTILLNKDIFEQAGITEYPVTWDEFSQACFAIKQAGFIPLTSDDAYIDTLPGYYLARAKGSDWVGELMNDKSLWEDPLAVQMSYAFENLAKSGFVSPLISANKWPAGQQEIANGTVAMYLNGTWLPNEIKATAGEDFPWGAMAFPEVPGGATGQEAANYGGQAFQIAKACAYPDVAFALIAHLTTGEWDANLANMSMGVPVGTDSTWPPQLAEAKAVFEGLTTFYPWAGNTQVNADMLPVLNSNFTQLISGKISAEQFIKNMQK